MGPTSTAEREDFRRRILAAPATSPSPHRALHLPHLGVAGQCVRRRVDFRPYVIHSADGPWVLPEGDPGGAPRRQLRRQQQPGRWEQDTWVLKADG